MFNKFLFTIVFIFQTVAMAQTPLKLSDCHLGSNVFNSFADIKIDLEKKIIQYKEFDKNNWEEIQVSDIECQERQYQFSCRSEAENIQFIFHNIREVVTTENQSLFIKIRFALGKDTLYANSIVGLFERPYDDQALKKKIQHRDTIHCVQDRF